MYFRKILFILSVFTIIISGCSNQEAKSNSDDQIKIGIMLSDVGLGDQSFSDSAFQGLTKARDELGIVFDYRELESAGSYKEGLEELVKEESDIVIGLGYMVQEDLEQVAEENPEQQFVLIDAVSELDNITSVSFDAMQGSYLAGVIAAITTETDTIGFIGGEDNETINDFGDGFTAGAKSVTPDIEVDLEYANDFGNDEKGAEIADGMIEEGVDVLFAAAGFTGVGALQEAQRKSAYAIGVDSDQYYYAEKSVITSVLKKVDVAVFDLAKQLVDNGEIPTGHIRLGIANDGVGLAPVRVIELSDQEKQLLDEAEAEFSEQG
ncbi:BMP family lipoprotein [Sediminibacillus massiliensis]|uniref:BMP family lipoprotein n=1 Tax=Sediminibacillus massiliensis TaxID=1926277 RepID=UPI0009886FDC|nr:BMP family ABC transporter substrate-binding protein [Sediminibacillus massiliensis]